MLFFSVIQELKHILPSNIYQRLRRIYLRYREMSFFRQGETIIKIGKFEISCPRRHPIIDLYKSYPYRDLNIGITAGAVTEKYRHGTVIDIGANIGDTAAIIATYSHNKLILVEPSDYFFKFLAVNAERLGNEVVLKKVLIGDGTTTSGKLQHWGGTAYITDTVNEGELRTHQLSAICDENTCLIKIDTDGYDFKIITAALDWLSISKPAIIFENQIFNDPQLIESETLFEALTRIGYQHFIFWDDAGFYLTATDNLQTVSDLNRYLFKSMSRGKPGKGICGYDVLCLKEGDDDIGDAISKYYKSY